jgi:hypothetical protein
MSFQRNFQPEKNFETFQNCSESALMQIFLWLSSNQALLKVFFSLARHKQSTPFGQLMFVKLVQPLIQLSLMHFLIASLRKHVNI